VGQANHIDNPLCCSKLNVKLNHSLEVQEVQAA